MNGMAKCISDDTKLESQYWIEELDFKFDCDLHAWLQSEVTYLADSSNDDYEDASSDDETPEFGSYSTAPSSTLDRTVFGSGNRESASCEPSYETIIQDIVRRQADALNFHCDSDHLDLLIHNIRRELLERFGQSIVDVDPTDPEITYYILQEALSIGTWMRELCQEYFTRLAAAAKISSDGQTEATFKVTARDGSKWEVYVPRRSLSTLHDALERQAQRRGVRVPSLPPQSVDPFEEAERKEIYLEALLRLPVEVLVETKEVTHILQPVEGSPVGFDEVYDESLCYRIAEHDRLNKGCS